MPADIRDPYARTPLGQKVSPHHRGRRKTHFLVRTSTIFGADVHDPKGSRKTLYKKSSRRLFGPYCTFFLRGPEEDVDDPRPCHQNSGLISFSLLVCLAKYGATSSQQNKWCAIRSQFKCFYLKSKRNSRIQGISDQQLSRQSHSHRTGFRKVIAGRGEEFLKGQDLCKRGSRSCKRCLNGAGDRYKRRCQMTTGSSVARPSSIMLSI